MAYGVEAQGKSLSGSRDYAYEKTSRERKALKKMAARDSDKAGGRGGTNYSSGFGGEGSTNAKTLRGGRDSMSTGDMADMLPVKMRRIKNAKSKLDERRKAVPAGAQGGALGNAPLRRVTTGLRTVFRARAGSPSGNASGEINPRA